MFNQFILEAKYLDNINRVKRKNIIGVYASLEKIEEKKFEKKIQKKKKESVVQSSSARISSRPDLLKKE